MISPYTMNKHLILGGARSGKSAFAARLAESSALPVVFIATAQVTDAEMAQRIQKHQVMRPDHWQLVEEPVHLGQAIQAHASPERFVLVDCLTVWLTNLLLDPDPGIFHEAHESLLQVVTDTSGPLVLVGNETGCGIIPMGELTRRFVDENGRLHQRLACLCPRVTLMVAGLPLHLKGNNA